MQNRTQPWIIPGLPEHKVVQGECLTSIAYANGFIARTLWDHPENAALKELRKDPNVLLPGDTVHIPEKRERRESQPTGAQHVFVKKNLVPLQVRVIVDGDARSGEAYELDVDGDIRKGDTDGDGWIRQQILIDTRKVVLKLKGGTEVYELQLGHLDPVDTVSGAQGRLQNLGYYSGPIDGTKSDDFTVALSAFQDDQELEVTGELDPKTQQALRSEHGS